MEEITFCCERLKDAYEEIDPEHDVLVFTSKFDETQWFIMGWLIYTFTHFVVAILLERDLGERLNRLIKDDRRVGPEYFSSLKFANGKDAFRWVITEFSGL